MFRLMSLVALFGAAASQPLQPLQPFLQDLLKSDATGDTLLAAYDNHYDSMPSVEQLVEKSSYPEHIYKLLLEHRSGSKNVHP